MPTPNPGRRKVAKPTFGGTDPVLFGDQTIETTGDSALAGSAEAFRFNGQMTGSATAISIYVGASNQASGLVGGIYTDKRGRPGSLLATGSLSLPTAGAWNTMSITPTAIYAGRDYWIAILGRGGTLAFLDRAGGTCMSVTASKAPLASLPSPWSTGSQSGQCPASAYVSGYEAPPWNVVAPTVSGQSLQGQALTASTGSWGNSPSSYAYQWQRCTSAGCSDIGGATASTYTLQASDIGDSADVVVTASDAGGSSSATSLPTQTVAAAPTPAPTPAPPANTAPPTISGSAVQGQTLTAAPGTWTNSPTSYTYQWQDCTSSGCTNISGATASSYVLQASDVGKTIAVTVTAGDPGGSTAAASATTATVTGISGSVATNTALPIVTGPTIQGHTLSASAGAWTNNPTSFSYSWEDCDGAGASCSAIPGATASSYTLAASDVYHTIRVAVTATNGAGPSLPAVSVGSGSPSFNATGATPTVLGAPAPTWSATYDGNPGSWGSTSNGCNDFYNDASYTGWWGFDGNASGSGSGGYIGNVGWGSDAPNGSSSPYFGFTTGQSSNSPAFAGQAAQLYVDHNAATAGEAGQRSNLYQCPIDQPGTVPLSASTSGAYEGADKWYRLEVYFPSNYVPEPGTSWNWVAEFHNYPNDGTCCANISAGIVTNTEDGGPTSANGRFSWRIIGGGCPTATSGCAGPIPAGTDMGTPSVAPTYGGAVRWFAGPSLMHNHWYDILMHVHWAYEASQGSVQLWMDGAQLIAYAGPTLYYLASSSGTSTHYAGPGNDYLMVDNYRWGERTSGTSSCSTTNCDSVATAIDHDEDLWGASESSVGGGP
jgi:hypothetical protein